MTDLIERGCSHTGPCSLAHCPSICSTVQFACSRKYDVNLTWQFAEVRPDLFALFNPIRRELIALGSIEEVLAVYRAREPFIPVRREELAPRKPALRFQNVKVNI